MIREVGRNDKNISKVNRSVYEIFNLIQITTNKQVVKSKRGVSRTGNFIFRNEVQFTTDIDRLSKILNKIK